MKCLDCNGVGKSSVLVCPPGVLREIKCSLCNGSGNISDIQAEWIEYGKILRQERLNRDLSLLEEANRLGVSPVLLSKMEHGKIENRQMARRLK